MTASNSPDPERLMTPAEVEDGQRRLVALREGLASVIFGQEQLLDLCCIALAARGHLLLEGLPGLGKTELVKTLGTLLGLSFSRVQFTPDLLPSDITGGPVLQEDGGTRKLVFQPGPLFANLVLADEINRASPKTQSALLEAMQERRVTVIGETHVLPAPFFVLATQNPIELEGTYPLPEAQLDRFLFKVDVPSVDDDVLTRILLEKRRGEPAAVEQKLAADDVAALFSAVDRVYLPDAVARYIARLATATHPDRAQCPAPLRDKIRFGASPRAAIAMGEAARAAALLGGRPNVDFADVQRVATSALAHRIVLDHAARLDGLDARAAVGQLLELVEVTGDALPGAVE